MRTTDLKAPDGIARTFNLKIITIAMVLCFLAVLLTSGRLATQEPPAPGRGQMVVASGADRYPNSTASDWVTYSDHIVVGTVDQEVILPPTPLEVERGEGLILRDLSITVDEVLWSSPAAAATAAPDSFNWRALGWEFRSDPEYQEIPMTGEHEPRLELGQTYIIALERPHPSCSAGEALVQEWRGLGAAAIVPFENGVFGQGEFEGARALPKHTRAAWQAAGAVFPASLAGRRASALKSALIGARADLGARAAARSEKCASVADSQAAPPSD